MKLPGAAEEAGAQQTKQHPHLKNSVPRMIKRQNRQVRTTTREVNLPAKQDLPERAG
jgi:hypothetical protein